MPITKYRPYFTEDELTCIISLAKAANPPNIALIRYLEGFVLKIERGVIQSQHTLKPSLAEGMGFLEPPTPKRATIDLVNAYTNGERNFSPAELERIMTYRWENNMMSEEEQIQWEGMLFIKGEN